jgi:hypothetical protein
MARVYSPPTFNVTIDVWQGGTTPGIDPPTIADQPCQLYINARDPWKLRHDNVPTDITPIILRLPAVLTWTPGQQDLWRRSTVAGPIHTIMWVEIMHEGFPNQYIVAYSQRCDAGGNIISFT